MAAGVRIKHKRKSGGFTAGELDPGEFGLDTFFNRWYWSKDGSTVNYLDEFFALVGSIVTALDGLSDVTLSTPATHEFLRFNGAEWVNSEIADAHLQPGIDAAKIADGSVDSTSFQYLAGVTAGIQGQLDSKVDDSQLDTDETLSANSDALIASQKAVKAFVEQTAKGLPPRASCRAATTGVLPACTYANGSSGVGATLTGNSNGALPAQDGVTLVVGDRLLVKDESSALRNGLYKVTATGGGAAVFVLTRVLDADSQSDLLPGISTFISEGTDNGNNGFALTTDATIVVGTTALTFTQVSGTGQITAGNALTKTGNVLDVAVDNSTIEVSGDALRVKDAGITLAKLATMATASLLGRNTAGTGAPEVLSAATAKALLALVKGDVGLGNVDNTSNATERAATATLTNKRITKRSGTTASSATPTINTDNVDFYSLTAQTADITSFTTNLSGTPAEGDRLWIAITGTAARAITWGASFEAGAVALPTTTVTTARLDVGFVWNTVTSKWRCMASG